MDDSTDADPVPGGLAVCPGVPVVAPVAVAVLVGAPVGVLPDAGVVVAPLDGVLVGTGVRVLVGVLEGVGEGPAEVAVAVEVGVIVGVFAGVEVRVDVLVGVLVVGGESTVKILLDMLTGTALPTGSVAAALLSVSVDLPGAAPGSTSNITLATVPLGITS